MVSNSDYERLAEARAFLGRHDFLLTFIARRVAADASLPLAAASLNTDRVRRNLTLGALGIGERTDPRG